MTVKHRTPGQWILLLSAALMLAGTTVAQTGGMPASRADEENAELQACGIRPTPQDLTRFLQEGLPAGTDLARLPEKPPDKSQLVVYAMARVAAAKHTEAVGPLVSIAALNPPPGILALVDYDVARSSPRSREEFRQKALRILQFNAVNALGLIGDQLALPVVRAAFEQEPNTAARIQHSLSLACLGDPRGADFLVQVILQQNRRESAAAARAFFIVTGKDFGYTENTPVKARRQRAEAYAQWWKANRGSFQANPKAVVERRFEPVLSARFEPRSTRDLLKLSAFYFDFDNKAKTFDARERIGRAGKSLNGDLLQIMDDEMEDLDVRMEAMNWYYEFNRADARKALKNLRGDDNPEIVDKANALLEEIESGAAGTTGNRLR
jgi:hypothetical protein